MSLARETTHFLHYVVVSPEAEIYKRILVRSLILIPLDIF